MTILGKIVEAKTGNCFRKMNFITIVIPYFVQTNCFYLKIDFSSTVV